MQEIPAMRHYSASMQTNEAEQPALCFAFLLLSLLCSSLRFQRLERRAAAAAAANAVGAPWRWSERCYTLTRISSSETESSRWWRTDAELGVGVGDGVGVVSARHIGQLVLPRSQVSMHSAWK